jgi:hypothetical protein
VSIARSQTAPDPVTLAAADLRAAAAELRDKAAELGPSRQAARSTPPARRPPMPDPIVVEVDGPGPNILCPDQAAADYVLWAAANNARLDRADAACVAQSTQDGEQA